MVQLWAMVLERFWYDARRVFERCWNDGRNMLERCWSYAGLLWPRWFSWLATDPF